MLLSDIETIGKKNKILLYLYDIKAGAYYAENKK